MSDTILGEGKLSAFLSSHDMQPVTPFIDGGFVKTKSVSKLTSFDPATGHPLIEYPAGCRDDANCAVASARAAFISGSWSNAGPTARKAILLRWSELIQKSASRLNSLDALEMGKPISLGSFNADAAATFARFNAEAIDKVSGEVLPSDFSSTVIQERTPRGVVAAIVPWNFPTYNCILKVAPALAAGNAVVLKPSELANQSALLLAELAIEAGIPVGIFNVVPGVGEVVGRALAEHYDVDMLTFTGSTAVGKLMLQYAGNSNMKVVSAECGGKSPHLVFNDGLDIDAVAKSIAEMISINQGQVCSVGSRVLVQDEIEHPLVERIMSHLKDLRVGNPQFPGTTYGPLASKSQLERVQFMVAESVRCGAKQITGREEFAWSDGGYWFNPTILSGVTADNTIVQEEVFGPVLAVTPFRDLEEALRLASSTRYGLAAYIWSANPSTVFHAAKSLQTAITVVNSSTEVSLGPGFAYSGEPAKMSGLGVEGGVSGLEAYMRRQTIWFNHGRRPLPDRS